MKAFAGWRAVGRAMRWARRQQDITSDRTIMTGATGLYADHRWFRDGDMVMVSHAAGHSFVDITIGGPDDALLEMNGWTAFKALRVLAGLGLIPDEQTACGEQCTWCGGAA